MNKEDKPSYALMASAILVSVMFWVLNAFWALLQH
jgi:hypothetical protein